MTAGHPIRSVAKQTGLSPHQIRIWERRYRAVSPERSDGNHRLYSDDDIYRLKLLKHAAENGESIGQISNLSNGELLSLVEKRNVSIERLEKAVSASDDDKLIVHFLNSCLDSIVQFDSERLESTLLSASIKLSRPALLERLLDSLLTKVGELWQRGEIKVAHEHAASSVIRSFLGNIYLQSRIIPGAPTVICATPRGQVHELGALMAAASADAEGWNSIYLGSDVPADSIADAVALKKAEAVALSITYSPSGPEIIADLRMLRRLLPDDVALLIGGRSAHEFDNILLEIGATLVEDLADFRSKLRLIRAGRLLSST